MSKKNLFMSWLVVKVAIVGLLFILLGFNYMFSMQVQQVQSNFWFKAEYDLPKARQAVASVGGNIDQFDNFGYTALMMACGQGNVDVVDFLIKNGANINLASTNVSGDTAFHLACRGFKLGVMDLLLKNNASPLLKNKRNETPFSFVSNANTLEEFKKALNMFLAKGIDINYPNFVGIPLLFTSVNQTQFWMLNTLQTDYAHLVDFDFKDKGSRDIFQYAGGPGSPINKGDIIRFIKIPRLERLNAAMSVNDYNPKYAFNENFNYTLVATIKGKYDLLLEAIKPPYLANLNLADKSFGNTCLHWACLYNWPKCIEILVKNKADANIKNKAGMTPIHCLWGIRGVFVPVVDASGLKLADANIELAKNTLWASRTKIAKLLFDAGANFNAQDENGNTFLHNAVYWADVDFVKLISTDEYFYKRVNFNLKNKNNKTAFEVAQIFSKDPKNKEIMDLLKNYNNISYVGDKDKQLGITPLMLACMRGDQVAANNFANSKDIVNQKDKNGDTSLHYAIRFRHPELAKLLIKSGANVTEKNNLGDAPINEIVNIFDREKRDDLVRLLLESGAVLSENKKGETLMHMAVRNNMPDLVLYLKQNFGKIEKNKDGKTAYDLAKELGAQDKEGMKAVLDALDGGVVVKK